MADENDNGNEQDFEAPIWNEDRTAMIRYVDHDSDREFGGEVYEFSVEATLSGKFVIRSIGDAFKKFLENEGINYLEYLDEVGFDEYYKKSTEFNRKYGARFKINKLLFLHEDAINYDMIHMFISYIFPLIWKMKSKYKKLYIYFNPLIHVRGMTKALHELGYGLHGCYCGPEPGAKCDERLCFDAEPAG